MRRAAIIIIALAGCGGGEISGAERGAELFESRSLSPSGDNRFSCATCHATDPGEGPSDGDAGYRLYGVMNRPLYWGEEFDTVREATDACLKNFMRGEAVDPGSEDFHALYEYLLEISPSDASNEPYPFTVVENVLPLPCGDADRGEAVYDASCRSCHGAAFTGSGTILESHWVLPAVTEEYEDEFPGIDPSLVVIEKVRHGRFFDIGVDMPFFSREVMSDEDIADVIAYLELPCDDSL